jgi:hypothetical protein
MRSPPVSIVLVSYVRRYKDRPLQHRVGLVVPNSFLSRADAKGAMIARLGAKFASSASVCFFC